MGASTTRARSPRRGRTRGRRRPPPGTGHGFSRNDRRQPSPAGLRGHIWVRRTRQLLRRIQRQSPAPGRQLIFLSGPDRRPGVPAGCRRPGVLTSFSRNGVRARGRDWVRARGRAAEARSRRGQPVRPRRHPARLRACHAQRRSIVTAERVAAPGTAARPGDPGSAGQRSAQRGIPASRVAVERRRLPDGGSQRTWPGTRIPARTRGTRPDIPAGPVLTVERACAPRGACGWEARADGRVGPRDIRA